MSVPDNAKEAHLWFRYALQDLEIAQLYEHNPKVVPRHACFLAQQAAEKALKAVLVYVQGTFPYSHDLELLLALLPDDCDLKTDHPDLSVLTGWASEARYPGDLSEPSATDASDSVATAAVVLDAVRADLERRGLSFNTLQ